MQRPHTLSIKRWFKRTLMALVILGVLTAAMVLLVDWSVERTGRQLTMSIDQLNQADCVIVPGALVYSNQRPSPILQDRLDVALQVYRSGITDRIVVSGDHGTDQYDEANVMRRYLLEKGVPPEHVFMDHAGFDTYDTMYRARDVFQVSKAIVVTQTFHLNRALYIGQQLGLEVQGVPSDLQIYQKDAYYRFREYPARFKAFLDCHILRSTPTYLGKPIPITGSGLATVD